MAKKKNKWEEIAEQSEKEEQASVEESATVEEEPTQLEGEESVESIEFPGRDRLEDQLTAVEMKLDEAKNIVLRKEAEMENLRKRTERDVAHARKFAVEKLLADMLPVIDSLDRALQMEISEDPQTKAMHEGMMLTLDILEKTITKHGVEVINPEKGEAFNPDLHEAMTVQPDPKAKSNTVLQVLQKGYSLNGRVLRPAMVMVAQ